MSRYLEYVVMAVIVGGGASYLFGKSWDRYAATAVLRNPIKRVRWMDGKFFAGCWFVLLGGVFPSFAGALTIWGLYCWRLAYADYKALHNTTTILQCVKLEREVPKIWDDAKRQHQASV